MLLVTTEQIPGRSYRVLGLVQGSTIQCKNIGHDFLSGLQNLVGGEMESYTQMMRLGAWCGKRRRWARTRL